MRFEASFLHSKSDAHTPDKNLMVWLYLCIAIIAEVAGTLALKYTDGFTKPLPLLVVVIGYGLAFFLLAKVVQVLPLAITYAIWSGVGIALVGVIGWLALGQKLDAAALVGVGLIVSGVVIINLFSSAVRH